MKRLRSIVVLLGFIAIPVAIYLYDAWQGLGKIRRQTPLGEFAFMEITVAGQRYQDASHLQRVLERFLPRTGVRVGELRLRPAIRYKSDDSPMTAWVVYRGTNITFKQSRPRFDLRASVKSSTGRVYPNAIPMVHRSTAGEALLSLPLSSFPSDEKQLTLQLTSAEAGTNQVTVEFIVDNPLYLVPLTWVASRLPQTNMIDGKEIVLGEVTLYPALLEFQLPRASWSATRVTMEDANGHSYTNTRLQSRTSGANLFQWAGFFQHRVETNTAWRIGVELVNHVDKPTNSQRILNLTADDAALAVTNQSGEVLTARFDGQFFSITQPSQADPNHHGWVMVSATNATTGEPIQLSPFASVRVRGDVPSQRWPLPDPCTNLVVHLFCPATLQTAFYLQPTGATLPAAWARQR